MGPTTSTSWAGRLKDSGWRELAEESWVWYTDACPCRALLERQLKPYCSAVRKVATTDYEGTLKALVASGAGLGLMHQAEAQGWEKSGEVCIWPHDSLPIDICFLHRRDRAADPALCAVLAALRQVWGLAAALGGAAPGAC